MLALTTSKIIPHSFHLQIRKASEQEAYPPAWMHTFMQLGRNGPWLDWNSYESIITLSYCLACWMIG